MFHLLLLWGEILKVNLTIQMEIRHWNQDKWEAILSKNRVREGYLRFSDKQLIYSTWRVRQACVSAQRYENHLA